ncbi:MAG: VCBS repeat-containing protein [Chloroflexi bacterium]|nr:VCBS repeat-containing protein [Chloroflexota bacterium]
MPRITRNKELVSILSKYGYYKGDFETRPEDQAAIDAIKKFQMVYGLPATGRLDRKTTALIKKPRCEVSDAPLVNRINLMPTGAFALASATATANYSNGDTIKYRINGFSGQFDQDFEKKIYASAFKIWSNIFNIEFKEVTSNEDFSIEWRDQSHFSSNTVLAHANSSHISFNEDYTWSDDRTTNTYDLLSVSAHEVGHVLGLDHESGYHDIMFAFFGSTEIRRFARKGEFDQARSIYHLRSNKGSIRHGITVGDFDGDSADEIALLRNSDGNTYLFRFDNNNNLIEEASNWHPGWTSKWIGSCAADLAGTGQDALIGLRDYDDGVFAWQSKNDNLSLLASNTDPGPNSGWIKVVGGDFDGDGKDEIIAVRDYDDGFYMYRYDGTSRLKSVAKNTDPGPNSKWIDMVSGDFDGDGKDEIIAVRDYDDGFYMYRYDGTSKLKSVAKNTDPGPNSAWIVLGVGDIDGDGKDEVVGIRDYDDGFFVYKYDGSQKLNLTLSNTAPGPNSAWRDITIGDFDGDGVDEIMAVRDYDDGIYMLKVINGKLNIVAGNTLPGPNSDWKGIEAVRTGMNTSRDSVALIRDYDGDIHLFDYDPASNQIRWLATG